MNQTQDQKAESLSAEPKKPYETPEAIELGTVAAMTQVSNIGGGGSNLAQY